MHDIDLSVRPRGREELADWYAAALEDQAVSGLSMTDYAGELGVTAATLYSWRRRLAEFDDVPGRGSARSAGLVQVSLSDEATGREASFVVHLSCDIGIEVPADFDPSALRRLVQVLESC